MVFVTYIDTLENYGLCIDFLWDCDDLMLII